MNMNALRSENEVFAVRIDVSPESPTRSREHFPIGSNVRRVREPRACIGGIRPQLIVGPPGTGKTATALGIVADEVRGGVLPASLAFMSFTRAAVMEARSRVAQASGLPPSSWPWFRTVHSTAFALLGVARGAVMTDEAWGEFGRRHGYQFTRQGGLAADENGIHAMKKRTLGDQLRYLHFWGRNRLLDPDLALARTELVEIRPREFGTFIDRLDGFKAEKRLMDFCDLLEDVLRRGLRPDVRVALVDEAQDLSPLQIAVVESWFGDCERWYVLGDEDQAIYSFNGADPSWILALDQETRGRVLTQSHRVPAAVFEIADQIVRRNVARLDKAYFPTGEPGKVHRLSEARAIEMIDGTQSTFVLARNRMFLVPYARALIERRVPFVVDGGGAPSPFSTPGIGIALRAARELVAPGAEDRMFEAVDVATFLEFVPSAGNALLPRGVKARLKTATARVTPRGLDLLRLVDAMRERGAASVMTKLTREQREYFQGILNRYGGVPEPVVRLTSIHGAKGAEADLVIVVPDMTPETMLSYRSRRQETRESENRVFYVAVTRARRELVLVEPRTKRHFDWPRPQWEEGRV